MVSLNTKSNADKVKIDLKNRPSIDLICVIDQSGSMAGAKIKLVQDTLKYLLELLNENDRLCLVLFESSATRLSPLYRLTK